MTRSDLLDAITASDPITARRGPATEFAAGCAAIAPHIDTGICALESVQRDIVVQHYLQGRTADTIAAQQGLGLVAVFRLLDQALDQLQDHLAEEGVSCRREEIQAVLRGDVNGGPPRFARLTARVLRQTHPGGLRRVLGRVESLWRDLAAG